jgi:cell fate regulator YaaT (PSP1 superfamily)
VGEMVAVEGNPGHDIGMVSLTGDLVLRQMKRHKVTLVNGEMRKVYRKAKPVDLEKWEQAMQREHETMIRSRQLAADLKLNMKIGDVEYQGDGTKAIFYYIADDRVDFRQLIKVLAETFHIRIEMKQIGARQEAGRIGGIGPCGRELCCSAWMSSFSSVSTSAARYQELSLNPQKLAGQCSKLKCCMNYEVDNYIDVLKLFPPRERLATDEGEYAFVKSDVLKRTYWYAYVGKSPGGLFAVPVDRVKSILNLNRRGNKPARLLEVPENDNGKENNSNEYATGVGQDSLTRFDKPRDANRRNRRFNKRKPNADQPAQNTMRQETSQPENRENRNRNNRQNDQRNRRDRRPNNQSQKREPNN